MDKYRNDGAYTSIYNAVLKSKLHLAIEAIILKSKSNKALNEVELVDEYRRIFHQDIVLLDDY